jgi:putative SOS response-associated peptidase YedK
MPVLLKPACWPVWFGEELAGPSELKALLAPFPSEEMTRRARGWKREE